MDENFKNRVMALCQKYFHPDQLPIVFYYSDSIPDNYVTPANPHHRCVIANLPRVLKGETLCLSRESIGCAGGKYYLGFSDELRPGFEHFLSCGVPGKSEGIRFKKTPELVKKQMKRQPPFKSPGRYIIFKRWDKLDQNDNPRAAIFFASPDLISALFTLANFDNGETDQVISPSCAGCASIVYYPLKEVKTENPRAVLGMFDVTARPYLPPDFLTMALPWPRMLQMMENVELSFLINEGWSNLKSRLK